MAEPPAPAGEAALPVGPALLAHAWERCYVDAVEGLAAGRRLSQSADPALAAAGWLHVALGEVRAGDAELAEDALHRACAGLDRAGDRTLRALCDDIAAVLHRRRGDMAAAEASHDAAAARCALQPDPVLRFIAHNARGITAKLAGHFDDALHHAHAAAEAAEESGLVGPRLTAQVNLGSLHQDVYNFDDALDYTEEALRLGRQAGARASVGVAANNLVIIHHALGQPGRAREIACFLGEAVTELPPGGPERYVLARALGHLSAGEYGTAEALLAHGAVNAVLDGDAVMMWAWLKARCRLAAGDAVAARDLGQRTLAERQRERRIDPPFDQLELLRATADACEALGDHRGALAHVRQAHLVFQQLVGRSARARCVALQVQHQLAQARRERDQALHSQRSAQDEHRRVVDLNAQLQAQIAQTELLHAQLREQALRDALTGLHNRRYLFEMAPGLLELARRQGGSLAVVLLDLDHFKLINDTHGHGAGDAVLQRFAALLQQHLRRGDVVCRYGGEEFVAVMPDIDAAGAEALLNRLLEACQQVPHDAGRRRLPRASFSAGVSLFPADGHTLELLLSRADRALYAAKHQGRARVERARSSGFTSFS